MRKIIVITMALALLGTLTVAFQSLSHAIAADKTAEVEVLIKEKIDAVLAALTQPEITLEEKKAQVLAIIEPVMDFPLMAKLSLGKTHWSRMTPDQRTEFVSLFAERLKKSYLEKISLYSDQKVVYGKGQSEGGKISASMELITKDSTIEVIYKFYPTSDGWKVYDVEIEGVSFIKSYRAQFNEMLKKGDVAAMLEKLRQPVSD